MTQSHPIDVATLSPIERIALAEALYDSAMQEIDAALRAGKSGTVEREGAAYFLTVQVPPVRLVMIGAVHISQALSPVARIAGHAGRFVWGQLAGRRVVIQQGRVHLYEGRTANA